MISCTICGAEFCEHKVDNVLKAWDEAKEYPGQGFKITPFVRKFSDHVYQKQVQMVFGAVREEGAQIGWYQGALVRMDFDAFRRYRENLDAINRKLKVVFRI